MSNIQSGFARGYHLHIHKHPGWSSNYMLTHSLQPTSLLLICEQIYTWSLLQNILQYCRLWFSSIFPPFSSSDCCFISTGSCAHFTTPSSVQDKEVLQSNYKSKKLQMCEWIHWEHSFSYIFNNNPWAALEVCWLMMDTQRDEPITCVLRTLQWRLISFWTQFKMLIVMPCMV